jgi:hypothetical protein
MLCSKRPGAGDVPCQTVYAAPGSFSTAVLLEFPVTIIERTHLTGLEPSGDAVEVESVIADSPSNCALFVRLSTLVGLTFNAWQWSMRCTFKKSTRLT